MTGAGAPAAGADFDGTVHRLTREIRFTYDGPVSDVTTALRVGRQASCRFAYRQLRIDPIPDKLRTTEDRFGNHLLELHHARIAEYLDIVLTTDVGAPLPCPHAVDPSFLAPTPLTTTDRDLDQVLNRISAAFPRGPDRAEALARALCRLVHRKIRYREGSSRPNMSAAEVWASREGVCRDFSHVLIALCRRAGLPARYVAGCQLDLSGRTGLHAWVEVHLPNRMARSASRDGWVALDPARPGTQGLAMAVGRDYDDAKSVSGRYRGEASATLRTITWIDPCPEPLQASTFPILEFPGGGGNAPIIALSNM